MSDGDNVTFKALTAQSVRVIRVEMKAGVVFPDPNDPTDLREAPASR